MSDANGQQLPSGWVAAGLGAIGTLICGQSPPSPTVNREGRGAVYISGPEHWDGSVVHADKWTTSPARMVPVGTVFITVKGAGVGTVFPGIEAAIGRDIYAFLPADVVPSSFVIHALRFTTTEIVRQAQGDIPGLSKDHILGHRIAIPPIEEQKRIADKIDELLSDLDAGVAALERVQAKLKHYRAAVLKAAVEGALTAEWRAQHPATEPASALLTRILAERRRRWEEAQLQKFKQAGKAPPKDWKAKYKEPVAPDTRSLATLPKGWCWVSLDQLAWAAGYGTSEKCRETSEGLAVLRIPNIVGGHLDVTNLKYAPPEYQEPKEELVKFGDLLIVRTNGSRTLIGRGAVIRKEPGQSFSFASYLIRLRLIPFPSLLNWVSFLWDCSQVRQWIEKRAATSAGQHNISLSVLETLVIPLPPEAEQIELADCLEDQLSVVEHLEADLEAKVKSAQALRQSILRHAFTGQLVPQDPKDEPAAELLKRIAAQREELARQAKAAKKTKPQSPPKRAAQQTKKTTLS